MWQDIRYALRRLAHERAFTAAAVLTLTLGVGANVAVFAVVEAVLLRPLPYADADRLVVLNHRDDRTGITKEFIAIGDYLDISATQTVFEEFAAFNGGRTVIYDQGDPIVATSLAAGPGLLQTLRIQPPHGRLLTEQDTRPGSAPVAMLGYSLWQRAFKGDPKMVGRRIRVGNVEREIVGIAPQGFVFPANADATTDLIVPYGIPAAPPPERKSTWTFAVGRLKAGADPQTANIQLTSLSQQMERDHPTQNQGSRYYVTSMRDAVVGDTKKPLALLAIAVGAVLLIACVNVGNLLLVRACGPHRRAAHGHVPLIRAAAWQWHHGLRTDDGRSGERTAGFATRVPIRRTERGGDRRSHARRNRGAIDRDHKADALAARRVRGNRTGSRRRRYLRSALTRGPLAHA
jgi:hypothetical protein